MAPDALPLASLRGCSHMSRRARAGLGRTSAGYGYTQRAAGPGRAAERGSVDRARQNLLWITAFFFAALHIAHSSRRTIP